LCQSKFHVYHEKYHDENVTIAGAGMADLGTRRIFVMLNKGFWLIWAAFPIYVWLIVSEILGAAESLAEVAPENAACLAELPQLATFSAGSQTVFWGVFSVEMTVYAVLLALAHQVIHRCATGQVFVAPMIASLHRIGLIIALWPWVDLILVNVMAYAFMAFGDLPVFAGSFIPDLPVFGVGLLMITIAAAMRMAVRLHDDAQLTI
jgi:hypothetical protein